MTTTSTAEIRMQFWYGNKADQPFTETFGTISERFWVHEYGVAMRSGESTWPLERALRLFLTEPSGFNAVWTDEAYFKDLFEYVLSNWPKEDLTGFEDAEHAKSYIGEHDKRAARLSRMTVPKIREAYQKALAEAGQELLAGGPVSKDELVSATLELEYPAIAKAREVYARGAAG